METNILKDNIDRERDSITSLLNYAYTREYISEYISEEDAKGALLLIDIDNFKLLNEMLGYFFGDQIIISVAKILSRTFRNSDIIGRISGDRFAVLIKNIEKAELVLQKAGEVCRDVQQIYCGEQEIKVSASIGAVLFDDNVVDYDELCKKAENALYWAKDSGKNICRIYEENMENSMECPHGYERMAMSNDDYDVFYNEIAEMSFKLMENTEDADVSIQMILERIREYFGFAVIATLQVVPDKARTLKNIYSVVDEGIYNNKGNETQYSEERWSYIKKVMERGRYMFYSDTDNIECKNMFPKYDTVQKVNGLRLSMGNKAYLSGITDFVYVGDNHSWQEREIRLLESFTRILSVYINRVNTFDEAAYLAKMMKERDSVTGLYSYEMFLNRMRELVSLQKEPCEIAYTYSDFSNFKYINDTYGYNVGNLLLRKFGEMVWDKGNDDFMCAARVHSDNIVVARKNSAGLSPEEFAKQVDECNEYITQKLRLYGHDNMISIRSGVYLVKSDTGSIEEAVTNAGYACKKSKDSGNNSCMVFTDSLMEEYKKSLRYISELEKAIATGEMQVYIQPKTAADGITVVGGEALIRWIKPNNQVVFPGDFIPVFEKSGDIIVLDYFVYKEVFRYLRERMDKNLPVVPISVNVSKLHLKNDSLMKYLDELFEQYQIPVELIELELTENVYIEKINQALTLLNWCKEKHIKVAMDDFGSGYSSLNMLDQVPIDIMKIDRIFLKNQQLQKNDCIILESVINMAEKLNIMTVCEGVESKEHLDFLAEVGCDIIQGYYVGRPMPMRDFDKYLDEHFAG